MKNDQVVTDQSHKPRRAKSREVSLRFLSSPTTTETTTLPSPNHPISPVRRKPVSPFSDDRKPKTQLDDSGPTRGLWPSSNSSHKKLDTLADHLGNDRREDRVQRKDSIFDRGRSCMQVMWTFSIYLEAVAILPQLVLLQMTRNIDNLTGQYVFLLGAYRALYILNWIYRYFTEEHYVHWITWIAGIIQTLLYADFLYYYFQSVKLELPA